MHYELSSLIVHIAQDYYLQLYALGDQQHRRKLLSVSLLGA